MKHKKVKYRLKKGHFVVAGFVGLFSGFLLQGPEFVLKPGATFSTESFVSYSLISSVGVLLFMRFNLPREA